MATIKPVILAQNKREDGTWKVVYRLTHKRKSRYISTSHYVTSADIDDNNDIRVDFVIDYLSEDIKEYRRKISSISHRIDHMDVDDVQAFITNKGDGVDFLSYFDTWIEQSSSRLEENTVKAYQTVRNLLGEVFPVGLSTSNLTKASLRDIVNHCKSRKTSASDNVINIYITKIKKVFTDARKHYNDPDAGIIKIPNNPFEYWDPIETSVKIVKKAIPISDIRAIRDYRSKTFGLAAKTFMLTVYLCGINFIDLFEGCERFLENDFIDYYRRKTRKARETSYIKMAKTPEIHKLLEFFVEQKKISESKVNMHNKIRRNLKTVADDLEIKGGLTLYHGRHSFATIARNDCGFSKDDVAEALSHKDQGKRVTDIYIKKDYSVVFNVQDAVIKKINEDKDLLKN